MDILEIYRFNAIPIKVPMMYFTELEQVFQKMYIGLQKAPCSNSNPEKEEQNWRDHNTGYHTILQGHYNQDRLVLA